MAVTNVTVRYDTPTFKARPGKATRVIGSQRKTGCKQSVHHSSGHRRVVSERIGFAASISSRVVTQLTDMSSLKH